MKTIGNILWFIFGGFLSGLAWLIAGLLCCITVVDIPLGRQCFKFASLSFWPFGKEIFYGGGAPSTIANLVWILLCGWLMALENCIFVLLWTVTIVGFPFGKQFFKIAKLALTPFGARILLRPLNLNTNFNTRTVECTNDFSGIMPCASMGFDIERKCTIKRPNVCLHVAL